MLNFISHLIDEILAPSCAHEPCSDAYAFDHASADHLQDVQYAAEQNSLWCSAGADAGVGIDYGVSHMSDACGSYGDWHQL